MALVEVTGVNLDAKETLESWGYVNCLFSFFFFFFRATKAASGSSQARSQIRAAVASLHHSHSNARSEPPL